MNELLGITPAFPDKVNPGMSKKLFIATMLAQGAMSVWIKQGWPAEEKNFINSCYRLAEELLKQENNGIDD